MRSTYINSFSQERPMFRELLYVSIGLVLFAGIIFLFRTFDTSQSGLTGFAVRDSSGQATSPLSGNTLQNSSLDESLEKSNLTTNRAGGASAEFQVAVQVVNP